MIHTNVNPVIIQYDWDPHTIPNGLGNVPPPPKERVYEDASSSVLE